MAHKQLLFHAAAREKILGGASAIADAMEKVGADRDGQIRIRRRARHLRLPDRRGYY